MKIMSCINQEENKIQNCGVYCQQKIKKLIEEVWQEFRNWSLGQPTLFCLKGMRNRGVKPRFSSTQR